MPLVFPAVSTGAIICFVLSIADFGTPAILGKVLGRYLHALGAYRSELGGAPTMAVTVSILMMAISMIALVIQRRILAKKRYASSLTNLPVPVKLEGWKNWGIHIFCHGLVLIAMLPSIVVIYTSILKTKGPVFVGGFGFESYQRIWRDAPEAIFNSFSLSITAALLITIASAFISYVIVRRETRVAASIDFLMMVPYLVPGVVMAIGFVTVFRNAMPDIFTATVLLLMVYFIRRLPYGVQGYIIEPSSDSAVSRRSSD